MASRQRVISQRVGCRVHCSFWHGDTSDIGTNVHITTHLTHLTARRDMRRKNKQPYVMQSKVTCTHSHTLTPHHNSHLILSPRQGRAPEVSGLSNITSKRQLHTRVSNPCMHMLPQMHTQTSSHTSTRADEFVCTSLDPVPYATHQRLAKFLQWCVSKTFPRAFTLALN